MKPILNRDSIFDKTRELIADWQGPDFLSSGQGCLYWMAVGIAVIVRQTNLNPIPQAGSVSWPIITPEMDDGKVATHFSMLWDTPDAEAIGKGMASVSIGGIALPEMHCWIGIPTTNDLVDFSAGHIPVIAKKCGFEWRAPVPPKYIWSKPSKLPDRVYYEPNRDATILASQLMVEVFGEMKTAGLWSRLI